MKWVVPAASIPLTMGAYLLAKTWLPDNVWVVACAGVLFFTALFSASAWLTSAADQWETYGGWLPTISLAALLSLALVLYFAATGFVAEQLSSQMDPWVTQALAALLFYPTLFSASAWLNVSAYDEEEHGVGRMALISFVFAFSVFVLYLSAAGLVAERLSPWVEPWITQTAAVMVPAGLIGARALYRRRKNRRSTSVISVVSSDEYSYQLSDGYRPLPATAPDDSMVRLYQERAALGSGEAAALAGAIGQGLDNLEAAGGKIVESRIEHGMLGVTIEMPPRTLAHSPSPIERAGEWLGRKLSRTDGEGKA